MREENIIYDRSPTNRNRRTNCVSRVELSHLPTESAWIYYLSPLSAPNFETSQEIAVDMGFFYLFFTQYYLSERPKVRSFECTRSEVP